MKKHNFEGISLGINHKINAKIEKLNSLKTRKLVTSEENQYTYLTFLQSLDLSSKQVFNIYTNTVLQ